MEGCDEEMERLQMGDLIERYLGLHDGVCSLMCEQRRLWNIDDVCRVIYYITSFQIEGVFLLSAVVTKQT